MLTVIVTEPMRSQADGYSDDAPIQPDRYQAALDQLTWALIQAAAIRWRIPVPSVDRFPGNLAHFRMLAMRAVLSTDSSAMGKAKASALREFAEQVSGDVLSEANSQARQAIEMYEGELAQAAERIGGR